VSDGVATTPWGPVALPGVSDGDVTLVLRPDALSLSESDSAGEIEGTVAARNFRGDHTNLTVATKPAGSVLELEVRGQAVPEIGEAVRVAVDSRRVNVLPSASPAPAPRT